MTKQDQQRADRILAFIEQTLREGIESSKTNRAKEQEPEAAEFRRALDAGEMPPLRPFVFITDYSPSDLATMLQSGGIQLLVLLQAALRQAMKGLQGLEDSLPYQNHKKIREDIPVGVYDVVADFGQSRGGNTATILPNESYVARRYGRTILLRANIMRDPNIFESTSGILTAAIGEQQAKELTPDGNFYRTLWHEVGHYLGVDRTRTGRELDEALQDNANAMEEMKADLVSLFVAEALHKQGYYTDAQLRSVYAGGILRVLQNNKPRRDQPYNTMQLMQWNFFLENGLLTFENGILKIHYDKYHDVVGKLLKRVLDVQYQGDKAASDRFIDQYAVWREDLHGVVAKNIRDAQRYRFRVFKYAALGE